MYNDDELKIHLEPLAIWCKAEYIEQRVKRINANDNKLELEDGSTVDYDILAINIGSKTKGTLGVSGVFEHSLTTRPINDILWKIKTREQELLLIERIPVVAICGAGAAGTELSFAFKKRWGDLFKADIPINLISAEDEIMKYDCEPVRKLTVSKLQEKGINIVTEGKVTKINSAGIVLHDGREIDCDVAIWATGAEA